MIRKYARLVQPPEVVSELFRDIVSWPHWFPGIRTVRWVEGKSERRIFDLTQDALGREWEQRLEVVETPHGFDQRQIRGKLKRWDARWRFLAAPDGPGTTLSLELDLDLGWMGRLTPHRVVQQWLDRLFEDTISGARTRLRELERAPGREGDEPSLLAVYETPAGLEIQIGSRRYRLQALD